MLNKAASRTRLRKGKELKDAEQGCIADTLTFSLFFLTPQMQSLTLKRYVFWGIQLAFPCFLSEKRGEEELFVR